MSVTGGRPTASAHRPPGDRHQVATVGVAADVPSRLHLEANIVTVSPEVSGTTCRRGLTDRGCVREDSGPSSEPYRAARHVHHHRTPSTPSIQPAAMLRWAQRGEPLTCWRDPVLRDHPDLLRQRRAPPRPRVHHDRRRRAHPVAPPPRRRRQVRHRHRRARPQDPADGRGRRAVAAGVRRRDRPEVRRGLEAPEHRQRRLHPHHRATPQGRRRRTPPALLRRRRHRTRHLRRQVLRRLRGVLQRRRTDHGRRPEAIADCCPIHQPPGRVLRGGELVLPPLTVRGSPPRLVRRPPDGADARASRQRGDRAHQGRAARLLDQPHVTRVGHPAAVGSEARHLRVVRRAHQLPRRRRLRRRHRRLHATGGPSTTT